MSKSIQKIIIVDDEEAIRLSFSAYLEDLGFEIITAASAEEALKVFNSFQADLAIVDIRLPKMDGNQLIKKMQELDDRIKFLIHTGSVYYQLPAELSDIGIRPEQILIKPLNDINILMAAIQKLDKGI